MTERREKWLMIGGATLLFGFLFILPALLTVPPDDRAPDSLNAVRDRLGCDAPAMGRVFMRTYKPAEAGKPFGRWNASDRLDCADVDKAAEDTLAVLAKNDVLTVQNEQLNFDIARMTTSYLAAKDSEERALEDAAQAREAEQVAINRSAELRTFADGLEVTVQDREATIAQQAENLQAEIAQNAQLRTDLTSVTQTLSQREQALSSAQISLSTETQEKDQLSKIRANLDLSLEKTRGERDELRQELDLTTNILKSTQNDLNTKVRELEEVSLALSTQTQETRDAKAQYTALQERLVVLSMDMRTLTQDLERKQAEALQLQQDLDLKSEEFKQIEAQLTERTSELEAVQGALVVTESELLTRLQQVDSLTQRAEVAEGDLEIRTLERDQYLIELEALRLLADAVKSWDASLRELETSAIFVKDGESLVISTPLFDPASASFREDAQPALERLAQALMMAQNRFPAGLDWSFLVRGHTDANAISTERFPSNWELSAARAASVTRFLIENGIDPARLRVAGQGEFQLPTADIEARRVTVDFQASIYGLVGTDEL